MLLHVIDMSNKQVNIELLNEMIEGEKRFNKYLVNYNFRKWLLLTAYIFTKNGKGKKGVVRKDKSCNKLLIKVLKM